MLKIRFMLMSAAVLFGAALVSNATSLHTWVSGSGNDSNPCTFAAPCADFSTALAATTAGGTISVKDAGEFGPMTITQSVTIDGSNLATIVSTGGEAIYVQASGAANVTIRNLVLNGAGQGTDGIFFGSAGTFTVENCLITGFTQIGIGFGSEGVQNGVIKNTTIVGGQLGVRTFQSSGFVPNDNVLLQNVTIQGAAQAGVFSRNGNVQIQNSTITQSLLGVEADTAAVISVSNSFITSNTNGVCVYSTSYVRLDSNNLYDNATTIENCGGGVLTNHLNTITGTVSIPKQDILRSELF